MANAGIRMSNSRVANLETERSTIRISWMFNKTDPGNNAGRSPTNMSAPGPTSILRNQDPTPVGPSIHIKGEIRGNEDLVVHGRVEGSIDIGEGLLIVTREGEIDADVNARVINVEGRAEGNLQASEQIIVRKTGKVRGELTAPRVGLDFGCKFSGSIDSDVRETTEKKSASAPREQNVADFKAAKSGIKDGPSRSGRSATGKSSPR
jgi:cytoskeletal protein CcmA (bactofilin family)